MQDVIRQPHSLLEALFEVRYATESRQPLGKLERQRLHSAVHGRYPDLEQGVDNQIGLHVQTQGNQVQTRLTPPGQRHVFRARPPTRLLQLTDTAFTVNMLRPFAGWESFRDAIVLEWNTAKELLGLRFGPQMVLRFVNRFERPPRHSRIRDWLGEGPFVPSVVLDAPAGFAVKTQMQSDSETMTTAVTLGTLAAVEDDSPSYLALLLDIEVTFELATTLPTHRFETMLAAMYRAAKDAYFSSLAPGAFDRMTQGDLMA